ncbi:MAG TPA: bifunctional phosphoribosylaminoimidazolecarboxamide formyltransferase/IMP cyclohydrolase PurH, partial [Acidimicrobiales bacterium]|nr:bifunctional phosphoribosylaminoimidazolecarboxamide formyltransferase/IMP cyclohydrolase PurH [Acidimicrobiales bacterium]
VHDLGDRPAVAIIKHANPCGVAVADDITAAYTLAHECDPRSAFGGIVAVNRPVPRSLAEALAPVFTEVVVAPAYDDDALDVLLAKKNMRVLTAPAPTPSVRDLRQIGGGFLVQEPHSFQAERDGWRVVTKAQPSADQWRDVELAWRVVGHVKSNAIVLVANGQAVGIGAGQQNRVESSEIAASKAAGRAKGGVCASDAFFPFRDGVDAAAAAGVAVVVQPGGSLRDDEVIAAADEHGLAMVFTGERHFLH